MKSISFDCKFMLISAALLLAQGGIAMAGDITITPNQKITMKGPYIITQQAGQAFGDSPLVSVSRRVSYADIDLTTQSGYAVMKTRIAGAAKEVCRELDRRLPSDASDNRECVRTAAQNALRTVNVVVADLERALKVASAQ
jgi:UrcA family protein